MPGPSDGGVPMARSSPPPPPDVPDQPVPTASPGPGKVGYTIAS